MDATSGMSAVTSVCEGNQEATISKAVLHHMLDLLGILAGEPKAIERARIRREVAAGHDPRDRDDGIDGRRRDIDRLADRAHWDQAGWNVLRHVLVLEGLGRA